MASAEVSSETEEIYQRELLTRKVECSRKKTRLNPKKYNWTIVDQVNQRVSRRNTWHYFPAAISCTVHD